jgi:hypothetical protein
VSPELSVLIVNYNTWRECAAAIRSLLRHPPTRPDGTAMPYECIVVDNLSPRRPPDEVELVRGALAEVAAVHDDEGCGRLVLHSENAGYSKGVNLAFRQSRGRWILVSNPDLLFAKGMIPALQRQLERDPGAGITVPKGFWDIDLAGRLPPNTLPTLADLWCTALGEFSRRLSWWYSVRLARAAMAAWEVDAPLVLPMMSGCLFLIERSYFAKIGLMDERYPLYYEDADLSVTIARAGGRIVQVPDAFLVHFVNRSGQTDNETMWRRHDVSRRLYFDKWYGWRGRLSVAAVDWLLRTRLLRPLRRSPPHRPFQDLGTSAEKPVIRLPRRCERFLLQMSPDSRFYLSGGMFGRGDSWTPDDSMFANFGPSTYWYRAFDCSGGRFEPLGVWRYQCSNPLRHLEREVAEVPR